MTILRVTSNTSKGAIDKRFMIEFSDNDPPKNILTITVPQFPANMPLQVRESLAIRLFDNINAKLKEKNFKIHAVEQEQDAHSIYFRVRFDKNLLTVEIFNEAAKNIINHVRNTFNRYIREFEKAMQQPVSQQMLFSRDMQQPPAPNTRSLETETEVQLVAKPKTRWCC